MIKLNDKNYDVKGIYPIVLLITAYFIMFILNHFKLIPYLQVETFSGTDIPNPISLFTSIFLIIF